jgi:hypothetical protein
MIHLSSGGEQQMVEQIDIKEMINARKARGMILLEEGLTK